MLCYAHPPCCCIKCTAFQTKLITQNSTQLEVTNFFHIFEIGEWLIKSSTWTEENTVESENLTPLTARLTALGNKYVRDFPNIVQHIITTKTALKFPVMKMIRK